MPPIAVWRHPKKRHAQTPLVLLLHGRGADEYDLIDVASRMPSRFAFASVRAPVALAEGGYTWFESRGVAQPIARSLRESVATMRHWIETIATSDYHGPLLLFGFSAGMMMAGALLLDEPTSYAGAVLLSGALAFETPVPAAPERLAGLPVFYGSGLLDEVIPPELAARTETYLRERSGARLTARAYRNGHGITNAELGDIAAWLDDVV
ncbi:MAG: hypothetical protein NVSMB19_08750 [Vulcanimicrobiaceae bacterium]